jgi:hypothetical protein
MKKNKYIVELELQTGDVEKTTTKLVIAENEQEAGKVALLSEIHNALGDGAEWDEEDEDSGRIWDFNEEWIYTVYKVTLIESEEEYQILAKYL